MYIVADGYTKEGITFPNTDQQLHLAKQASLCHQTSIPTLTAAPLCF